MINFINMAIIYGIMVTFIMGNGSQAKCMGSESFIGKMDSITRGSTRTILNMARDKWSGIPILGTEAIGPTATNMVTGNR
jgi:hypothetical protein